MNPRSSRGGFLAALGLCLLGLVAGPDPAHAYVGPGAGFALLSSFMVVFITALIAFAALLAWPFRTLYKALRHRRKGKPHIRFGREHQLVDGEYPIWAPPNWDRKLHLDRIRDAKQAIVQMMEHGVSGSDLWV